MARGLVLRTSLYRDLTPAAKHELEQVGGRSVSEGAETAVWFASSLELNGVTARLLELGT